MSGAIRYPDIWLWLEFEKMPGEEGSGGVLSRSQFYLPLFTSSRNRQKGRKRWGRKHRWIAKDDNSFRMSIFLTNIFRLQIRHLGIPLSLILYSASLEHSDASDKMNPGKVHGSIVGLSLPSSPVYDENCSAMMSFLMRQGRKKEQMHFFPPWWEKT